MSQVQVEPANGFAGFKFNPPLSRGIAAAGFSEPRPIQRQTIPAVLAGRDVLGLAQTGTGKTAAFGLPVLQRLIESPGDDPRVLILAPTRELANQITAEIRMLAAFTPIKLATLIGGVSLHSQRVALRARPRVIVACPGRLLDLLDQRAVRLDRIETLILDEADHMFDMGFLPDVRRIILRLPKVRQNLLFSATMPKEIRRLADQILRDPHVVDLTHSVPALTIEHVLYPTRGEDKLGLLQRLIAEDGINSAIVFTRTKHRARRLAQQLGRLGHSVVALQGDMSQSQRDRAMNGFRDRRFDILVATDIVARGIDVEKVSHVVNFDMPGTADAYTHRIGRTGRAGCDGKAYTFVTTDDRDLVREVERRVGSPIPRRDLQPAALAEAPRGHRPHRSNGRGRSSRMVGRRRRCA